MPLTFAGEAAADLAYPAYNALKNIAPTFAALASAAEAAAVAAILADGALVLGAGLAGYAIGEAIMKSLEPAQDLPQAAVAYRVNQAEGSLKVGIRFKLTTTPLIDDFFVTDSPLVAPVSLEGTGGTFRVGVLSGAALTFTGVYQADPTQVEIPLQITSVEKVGGGVPSSLVKIPTLPPVTPLELPKTPGTITIPGLPDTFPITPTVVPNPNNDPDAPDIGTKPGVMVKIPEAGLQFGYNPNGVTIVRYKDPDTEAFTAPKVPVPPPPTKVASPPCPCDCPETDLTEVICRLKALESGLLNDGYEYTTNIGGSGQGLVVTDITDELVYVEIQIESFAPYERTQRSAPGTPTVFFIGWFSWMVNNFPSERTPISYLNHNFIAPQNATGYMFSLHDGASATSRYVTRKPKDYMDAC